MEVTVIMGYGFDGHAVSLCGSPWASHASGGPPKTGSSVKAVSGRETYEHHGSLQEASPCARESTRAMGGSKPAQRWSEKCHLAISKGWPRLGRRSLRARRSNKRGGDSLGASSQTSHLRSVASPCRGTILFLPDSSAASCAKVTSNRSQ